MTEEPRPLPDGIHEATADLMDALVKLTEEIAENPPDLDQEDDE